MREPNVLTLSLLLLAGACASTSESAGRDHLTEHVGRFSPPAGDLVRARIGVPQFRVQGKNAPANAAQVAADQLTTLAMGTQRFDVIERAQLDLLLKEQGLEGVVAGSELAKPAQVRGVDYLLIGRITNLRVKRASTGTSFNLANVPIPGAQGALGLFGIKNRDKQVKVECGVDLRLVDPSTGQTAVADFSEFDRTENAGAFGLQILGGDITAESDLQISEDDYGRILRLALDDCLRKMLPKVDATLRQRNAAATATPTVADAAPAAPR